MAERIFFALFVVLFCMVFIWFALLSHLFASLKKRHASTYLSLGSPTLIVNNNLETMVELFRFLFARHYRHLNDPPLERLCSFLVVFFILYVIVFSAESCLSPQPARAFVRQHMKLSIMYIDCKTRGLVGSVQA